MTNIEKLIIKYLNNSISKNEWDELNSWFAKSEDKQLFNEYIKINYAIEDIMGEFNTERTKNSLLEKIKKDKRSLITLRITRYLRYAAVVAILFGSAYFFQQGFYSDKTENIAFPSEDVITLELENGNLEVISEGGTADIINTQGKVIGKQKGNRITYTKAPVESEELVYNQLTVPFGKRFELELSDGSIVHLNAGTSLKYPVSFLKEGKREVFLVGEAFLHVAKDSKRPFTVSTSDNLEIQVLGTRFNVSNYPEDVTTEVVLVEGSVGLQLDKKSEGVILEPGFKGSFDRQQRNISTKPVITDVYTSWMKGELIFRGVSLENILKKLERHYNVTIINQNLKYSQKKFNANFGDEPIEVVLNYFKSTYGINYTIEDNKVILK
ncbi:FecR family protein [Maribacter algicola]|uniref:FecR family protein n=1 Tax=Meishania litoralis TaxID=3434685 RepID=A0ACC7LIW9_9FLAO